jgi:3-oxoadipate enol-lactonase
LTDLHYEVSGSGPAVCLVHSAVTDSRMWDRQMTVLAPHHTVVRYDLRGFGESPLPGGQLSNVNDLRGLLDTLEIDRAALVGNSFGGRVVFEFAVEHQDRVTKLVLVASGLRDHDWSDEMLRYFGAEDAAIESGDLDAAVELNLNMWVPAHLHDLVRPMQRRALEVQVAAYESDTPPDPERSLEPPASKRLGDLHVPTLVIVGDRDVSDFRELADRFAREIPGARLEVIEGAGHLPSLERPEEFDRLLLEFLQHGI